MPAALLWDPFIDWQAPRLCLCNLGSPQSPELVEHGGYLLVSCQWLHAISAVLPRFVPSTQKASMDWLSLVEALACGCDDIGAPRQQLEDAHTVRAAAVHVQQHTCMLIGQMLHLHLRWMLQRRLCCHMVQAAFQMLPLPLLVFTTTPTA
jgi:hypothetical protein